MKRLRPVLDSIEDAEVRPAADALVALLLRLDRQTAFLSEELASRYEEIDLLYTISEVLGHTVRFEEAATTIVRAVSEVVGARRASIAVLDEARGQLRIVAARGFDAGPVREIPLADPESIAAQVVRESRPLVGLAGERGHPEGRGYRGEAYLSVPICFNAAPGESRCLGVINLTDRMSGEGDRFSAADQKIVAAAANQIGAAIQLSRLVEQEREQQRLRDELELARDLQRLLLPAPSVLRGDAKVAARCLPTEAVGGDFYTFNRLGLGVVAVMLGDVASHGFPAALVMAAVMAAAGIQAASGASPDVTLRALHDSLGERLSLTETYLTVFYGILDPGRGRLTWASAGHPYAFRVPSSGPAVRLDTTAPPLGLGRAADITSCMIEWDKEGDLLCLWTDGLADSENDAGERFGEARLLRMVEERRRLEPEQIVAEVVAEADRFAAHPADDRTLLVMRL
ncbi:MAG TPA: SpoIIE family protein phosphatase [Gemmatimonadales bacterium]|nr:SpoIIE family protein phosphatase [Gemmatimonadales bacterium]